MLSNESKKQLIANCEMLGSRMRALANDHRDEARSLYDKLYLEGAIKAFTPLEHHSKKILDLGSQDSHLFGPVFGVDGGSTRPKILENGTMLCAVQAVIAGDGSIKHEALPLEAYRSLSFVTHSQRLDLGGAKSERDTENIYANLWRIHLSRTYLDHDVDRVVSGMARTAAESYHITRMLNMLDLEEGLFLLDGNLYPIGLYYYFAQGTSLASFDNKMSWTDWDEAIEILGLPLRVTEAFAERGIACVGINKNPGTSWLLEFTLDEDSQNWSSDAQFIKAVLSGTHHDELGYTGWFVQERYSLPQKREAGERATFDLFQRLSAFELQLEPEEYHTCFFYVYDPRLLSVIKIEVPRVVLNMHDPIELRNALLGEIARGKGVPNAIRRADSRARITSEEAMRLVNSLNSDDVRPERRINLDYYYDHSRGEPL